MRLAYCLLALFAALTCVFGTEKPKNCGRITERSFNRTKNALDHLCQALDKESSNSKNSSWKFVNVNCQKNKVCCARRDGPENVSYFEKETKNPTLCKTKPNGSGRK
uniref:Putative secreted protein n=1 Tax=Amblyomma americanum TaxID=6943 RepID=A0A0C9SEQ7_AMBAM